MQILSKRIAAHMLLTSRSDPTTHEPFVRSALEPSPTYPQDPSLAGLPVCPPNASFDVNDDVL